MLRNWDEMRLLGKKIGNIQRLENVSCKEVELVWGMNSASSEVIRGGWKRGSKGLG